MASNMPIRFKQGEIKKLLAHFIMKPQQKGSNLYCGIGKDGIWRTCKFDYHKDRDVIASGTAKAIANSLKFSNVLEMKEYIEKHL
ncbi:hypothetical protein [Phosphitispora sp. TUW77]|uniref:hypothetical protein n=1 Tax=Phosphitispora sp. TUW77 TaxID=3152361 RepID=UPI003AB4EC2F